MFSFVCLCVVGVLLFCLFFLRHLEREEEGGPGFWLTLHPDLPAGKVHAALSQLRIVTVFQAVDELIHAGDAAGILYLPVGCILLAPPKVILDRA